MPTTGPAAGAPQPPSRPRDRRDLGAAVAAILCYVPLEGVFIALSLYYLATERRRPSVRFAALQSLTHLGVYLVALVLLVGPFGAAVAFGVEGVAQLLVLLSLALVLVLLVLWNLSARVYACFAAYNGEVWVMPWLRPLIGHKAPAPGAAAPSPTPPEPS